MPSLEHNHTFKRVLVNGRRTNTFMCNDPHCNHTREKAFLVGKVANCPYCAQEFIISRKKLDKQGILHCDNCSKHSKKVQKTEDFLKVLEKAGQL